MNAGTCPTFVQNSGMFPTVEPGKMDYLLNLPPEKLLKDTLLNRLQEENYCNEVNLIRRSAEIQD